MIKNNFRSLGFYILISICSYFLSTILLIPFNWTWNKWLIIPETLIFLIVIYAFYHTGRHWLMLQNTNVQNAISLSLIPLIGLLVAIDYILYRSAGHGDVDPFVLFNEAYATPILFIFQNNVIHTLWKEFIVLWGFSFIPPIIMYIGLWIASKRQSTK